MLQLYIYLFLHKIFHINVKPKVEMCISQNHYITPFLRLNIVFNIIVLFCVDRPITFTITLGYIHPFYCTLKPVLLDHR